MVGILKFSQKNNFYFNKFIYGKYTFRCSSSSTIYFMKITHIAKLLQQRTERSLIHCLLKLVIISARRLLLLQIITYGFFRHSIQIYISTMCSLPLSGLQILHKGYIVDIHVLHKRKGNPHIKWSRQIVLEVHLCKTENKHAYQKQEGHDGPGSFPWIIKWSCFFYKVGQRC